ncbi:MAG: hypothetical protein HY901_23880 [Deltaproteobacteria bacterium]|nr:hypothetical protein [Deltaproteobacteria bacterium]
MIPYEDEGELGPRPVHVPAGEWKTFVYRREELYEQVWAEPVRTVAQRYGVSDVAFAKMCRRLKVPLPGRGYWAKKQAGRPPRRPALPALPKNAETEVSHQRWVPISEEERKRIEEAHEKAHAERQRAKGLAEEEASRIRLALARLEEWRLARDLRDFVAEESLPAEPVVPAAPEVPHRLVAKASKLLHRKNVSKTERGGLVCCNRERCLDIQVSPERLDRALGLMDVLLKALDRLKYRVEITEVAQYDANYNRIGDKGVEPNATRVLVDEEWLSFGIVERLTMVEPTPPVGGPELERWKIYHPRRVYVPKGTLQLAITNSSISNRFVWEDSKQRRLEELLADFVARLPEAALAVKAQRAQAERCRLEAEERQRREYEAQSRRWKEEQRAKDFQALIERWRLARDCRAYVAEARRAALEAGCIIAPGSEMEKSLEWALRYADRVDPLSELRIDAVRHLHEQEEEAEGAEPAGESEE